MSNNDCTELFFFLLSSDKNDNVMVCFQMQHNFVHRIRERKIRIARDIGMTRNDFVVIHIIHGKN